MHGPKGRQRPADISSAPSLAARDLGYKRYDRTEEAEAHRNPDAQASKCRAQNPKAGNRGYRPTLARQGGGSACKVLGKMENMT